MRVNLGSVQRRDVHTHLVQAEDPAADQGGDQHQGSHQPSHDGLIGSSMFNETLVDGRAVELPRSIIDQRLIDHAGLSNRIHCRAPVRLFSTRLCPDPLGKETRCGLEGFEYGRRSDSVRRQRGARWRRKARGMISRPGRRRSIADVGVRVTPNRRPRGTSSPRPGHWRGTVWPSRRRRLHAIPQAGAWTTREGPATHQPVIRGPSADDQQRRG